MAVRFMLGRAGSGKSRRCLDEIRDRLHSNPAGNPLILLVPEQATFQAEYALVTEPKLGGMIRAQVLSFRRLAFRVMQETVGAAQIHIDDTGKKMLLYKIMQKRKEELRLFHRSADQMGFIDNLNDLFNEFKRQCVTDASLEQYMQFAEGRRSPLLADKLHDLLLVRRDFLQELSGHYVDSEDYLSVLAEQIASSPLLRDAEIWIDGFHRFTPQESTVIEQLMLHCRNVTIGLCLDRGYGPLEMPDELDLFHPTAMTMAQLTERMAQLGMEQAETIVLTNGTDEGKFSGNPLLGFLEQNFVNRAQWGRRNWTEAEQRAQSEGKFVTVREAANRRAEVEGVAREMIRLVRDKQYRWRDLAVMMRNLDAYRDLVVTTFADFGIPYFLDQKRSVLHHPLVELIRSAVDVVTGNWRYDAVFRCVKTDLLFAADESAETERYGMDQLENYVLAYGIYGSRWTDGKPWRYKHTANLEEEDVTDADRDLLKMQQIDHYRKQVAGPLHQLQKELKAAENVRGMVEAVFSLLEQLDVAGKLEHWSVQAMHAGQPERAKEHAQLWDRVIDLFDQLVETMGEETMELSLFSGVLQKGLESISLGLVPPALDQVLVGSMDRTRSGQIEYSFILGVNDGVLPGIMSEDGIVTEAERESMIGSGLGLAAGSRRKLLDEQFMIYTALTTPSRGLWVSYPLADEEGKALLPSELIRKLQQMFPSLTIHTLSADPMSESEQQTEQSGQARQASADEADVVSKQKERPLPAWLVHPSILLSGLIVQLHRHLNGEQMDDVWHSIYDWFRTEPKWQPLLQQKLNALFYSNEEAPLLAATSRSLYGRHMQVSVSRMERFAACPFLQFAAHGLRLRERQVYRLEAPDIGQLFHAALSLIAKRLLGKQLRWGALTEEQCRQWAEAAVDQLAPRLQSEILFSSHRFRYVARKLTNIVARASIVLGEQDRRSQFAPVGLELDFGPGKTVPPLTFTLDNGCTLEVVGRIDRVDRADGEQGTFLRVIDYKSSVTRLNVGEVYFGLSLQMLTYLDVVVTHAERWLGRKASAAGVLYFHVHNPMLTRTSPISLEKAEAEMMKRFKMQGLLLADPNLVKMMDSALDRGYSQILPAGLKADHSFYSNSAVIPSSAMGALKQYVRMTIRHIGTEITNGEVGIEPYRFGQHIACERCSYKAVCQFDPPFDGNEFRMLHNPGKESVWQALAEAAAAEEDAGTEK